MKALLLSCLLCLGLANPAASRADAEADYRAALASFEKAQAEAQAQAAEQERSILGAGRDRSNHLADASRHIDKAVQSRDGKYWIAAWLLKARIEQTLFESASTEHLRRMGLDRKKIAARYEDTAIAASRLIAEKPAAALEESDAESFAQHFRTIARRAAHHFAEGDERRARELTGAALTVKRVSKARLGEWLALDDDLLRRLASAALLREGKTPDEALLDLAIAAWTDARPSDHEIETLHRELEASGHSDAAARLLAAGLAARPDSLGWRRLEAIAATRDGARYEHAPMIEAALALGDDPRLRRLLADSLESGYRDATAAGDDAEASRIFQRLATLLPALRAAAPDDDSLLAWIGQIFFNRLSHLAERAAALDESVAAESARRAEAAWQERAETARLGLPFFEEIERRDWSDPDALANLAEAYQAAGDPKRAAAIRARLETVQSGGALPGPYSPTRG